MGPYLWWAVLSDWASGRSDFPAPQGARRKAYRESTPTTSNAEAREKRSALRGSPGSSISALLLLGDRHDIAVVVAP